jgi:hypothetical protein
VIARQFRGESAEQLLQFLFSAIKMLCLVFSWHFNFWPPAIELDIQWVIGLNQVTARYTITHSSNRMKNIKGGRESRLK